MFLLEIVLFISLVLVMEYWRRGASPAKRHSVIESYVKKQFVLTPAEQTFLSALEKAVGNRYRILCQVRVADVINSEFRNALNKIWSKSFDFVLCDVQTTEALLVIELNDRTHERPDRVERDSFLADVCRSIGLPIIFQKVQFSYDVFELQGRIAGMVGVPVTHGTELPDDAIPQVFAGIIPTQSELAKPNPFRTRRSLKIGYAIASLVVIAVVIYFYVSVVPESISSGLQSVADTGKKQANQGLVQPKAARKGPLANQQRQALESVAAQREQAARDLAKLLAEQEKERAWQNYYHQSDKCEHDTDWNVTVECGNEHIRAKRAFEEKWRAEH